MFCKNTKKENETKKGNKEFDKNNNGKRIHPHKYSHFHKTFMSIVTCLRKPKQDEEEELNKFENISINKKQKQKIIIQ